MTQHYKPEMNGFQFRSFAECSCGKVITSRRINRHIRGRPGHYEVRRFQLSKDLLLRRDHA